jgi:DNA-binding NarL/FixJ family response regulator
MRLPLSDRQRAIVSLIADGYTRGEIAEELDIGRTVVRHEIAVLCSRYGCSTQDLPAAVEREKASWA